MTKRKSEVNPKEVVAIMQEIHINEDTRRKRVRVRRRSPPFLDGDCSADDSSVKTFGSEATVASKKRIGSRIDVRIEFECAAGLADSWR